MLNNKNKIILAIFLTALLFFTFSCLIPDDDECGKYDQYGAPYTILFDEYIPQLIGDTLYVKLAWNSGDPSPKFRIRGEQIDEGYDKIRIVHDECLSYGNQEHQKFLKLPVPSEFINTPILKLLINQKPGHEIFLKSPHFYGAPYDIYTRNLSPYLSGDTLIVEVSWSAFDDGDYFGLKDSSSMDTAIVWLFDYGGAIRGGAAFFTRILRMPLTNSVLSKPHILLRSPSETPYYYQLR